MTLWGPGGGSTNIELPVARALLYIGLPADEELNFHFHEEGFQKSFVK